MKLALVILCDTCDAPCGDDALETWTNVDCLLDDLQDVGSEVRKSFRWLDDLQLCQECHDRDPECGMMEDNTP